MKNKKILIISILAILVVGLAIGFAAFSSSLTISSSSTVTPNSSEFNVRLSSSKESDVVGVIKTAPATVGSVTAPNGIVAFDTFYVGDDSSTNVPIGFTEPGQSVTYSIYVRNTGKYTAYLNEIKFANSDSGSSFKVCTIAYPNPSTEILMNAACNSINATVIVNNGTKTETATNATKSGIDGFNLAPGATATVTIKFEYLASGTRADGSFHVSFGDIIFNYSTVD